MEETIRLDSTTEYLCGICTNTFRGDALIRHITEHIGIPEKKHAHFLWCKLCSPLLRNSDTHVNEVEYSNEMGITEHNCTTENPPDEINPYILPEGLNHHMRDNYEPVNFHNDYLSYLVPYVMNQNYSYDEFLYPVPTYSYVNVNFDALVCGGITYFSSYAIHVPGESVQFQEEVRNTGNHNADVARIEPNLNSTCNDNSCVDATIVETDQQVPRDDAQQIQATYAEPCLEDANAEVPSADNVKTQPDTTKVEAILDNDISEVSNTLNESSISKSSNAECQSYTSNSNRKRNRKNESHTVSFNLNNLGDGSSSSGHNSCEPADNKDCKSVSDYVVNGSKGQNCGNISNANSRRSNRRAKSNNVSGTTNSGRVSSNGLHLKNFNSRSDYPNSSDCDPHNKLRYDRNSNNNSLKNGNNLRSNQSRNDNSNSASGQASDLICNGSNAASNTHCDNESDGKSQGEFSGASSEVPKSNFSYSAAVKRSLN